MKKIITSRVFQGCFAGALALGVVVFIGFSIRSNSSAEASTPITLKNLVTTTSTTTTTTTAPPVLKQPAPANLPLLGAGITVGSGSANPNISAYEQRLKDLKFDPGTVDNVYDAKTVFAVQSLQKISGLPRTGVIGDAEINVLNSFQYVPLSTGTESNRFEVDLDKQVAMLFKDGQVELITTVSTGSQKTYSYVSKKTGRYVSSKANTPTGKFAFTRRYTGWEKSDLGRLYNPVYFKGGIAVHGYPSVPTSAASHGCVRIPMYVAEYFPSLVVQGQPVYIVAAQEVSYYADRVGAVVVTSTTTTVAPTTTAAATTTTSTSTTTTTVSSGP